jgi:hypothetical protein
MNPTSSRARGSGDNFQIISDISLLLVLAPKLEPPMDKEMESKFTQILRAELASMNVHLSSATFAQSHHLFNLSMPPDVSPLAAARLVMGQATRRFIQSYDELAGWGSVYHDRIFIKSGDDVSDQQLSDLLSISLGDI